jgi:hypothetical protein
MNQAALEVYVPGDDPQHRDRHLDNLFFPGMAWLIVASVFVGFAHSYYLAGFCHVGTDSCAFFTHLRAKPKEAKRQFPRRIKCLPPTPQ